MKVAICDDDKIQIEIIKENVNKYGIENNIDMDIYTYVSGEQLLNYKYIYDIVFVDIEMPDLNGLELTARLRMDGNNSDIVIVTRYDDKVRDAFFVQANDFINKPVSYDDIKLALDRSCRRRMLDKRISLFKDRISYKLAVKNISYIKAYNGYVLVNVDGVIYRRDEPFIRFIEEVDCNLFCVINRGLAINLLKVEKYKNNIVYLSDCEFRLSRRCKHKFIEKYVEADLLYSSGR